MLALALSTDRPHNASFVNEYALFPFLLQTPLPPGPAATACATLCATIVAGASEGTAFVCVCCEMYHQVLCMAKPRTKRKWPTVPKYREPFAYSTVKMNRAESPSSSQPLIVTRSRETSRMLAFRMVMVWTPLLSRTVTARVTRPARVCAAPCCPVPACSPPRRWCEAYRAPIR